MFWEILSLSRLERTLKLRDSLSGKCTLEKKTEDVAGQTCANSSERSKVQSIQSHKRFFERGMTHRFPQSNQRVSKKFKDFVPQLSQQNPRIEMGLSRKDLWMSLLSNRANSCDIHGRPTKFLRILHQQKHCQLGVKERESMKRKNAVRLSRFYRQKTG